MQKKCNRLPYIAGVFFGIFFMICGAECLYAGHDNSIRVDQNLDCAIDERFKLTSYIFHQMDDNVTDYDYLEFGTGLNYRTPVEWISLLFYYQQSFSKEDNGNWSVEKKPSVNVNGSFVVSRLKIYNQLRYEYRITPDWHDYRIKNYLEFSLYDIILKPYTGWEAYYENHEKNVTLHRIKIGIIENVYTNLFLGAYYRFDFSKSDNGWKFSRQLLGFVITMKFNYEKDKTG